MAREIYSPTGYRYLVTINVFFYLLPLFVGNSLTISRGVNFRTPFNSPSLRMDRGKISEVITHRK